MRPLFRAVGFASPVLIWSLAAASFGQSVYTDQYSDPTAYQPYRSAGATPPSVYQSAAERATRPESRVTEGEGAGNGAGDGAGEGMPASVDWNPGSLQGGAPAYGRRNPLEIIERSGPSRLPDNDSPGPGPNSQPTTASAEIATDESLTDEWGPDEAHTAEARTAEIGTNEMEPAASRAPWDEGSGAGGGMSTSASDHHGDRALLQQPARLDNPLREVAPPRPLVSQPGPSEFDPAVNRADAHGQAASRSSSHTASQGVRPASHESELTGTQPTTRPNSETGLSDPGGQRAISSGTGASNTPSAEGSPSVDWSDPDAGNIPLASASAGNPLQLSPPESKSTADTSRFGSLQSALTMVSGLGIVLAIFLLVAWGMRRAQPKALGVLPSQVVEVLGRAPLAGRQQVYLLRCGVKLVLVSVTPDGAETLTEITDPFEVDRMSGLCEQNRSGSSTVAFRRVLDQYARQGEVTHGA